MAKQHSSTACLTHSLDIEIRDLPSSMEFRRIAHAIKVCHNNSNNNNQGNPQQAQQQQQQMPSADNYNYSCMARTICPTLSKQFIQCWRQAQTNPNLTCETQRRGVEVCVGEHVSQAISVIDAGPLAVGASCLDLDTVDEETSI